MFLKKNTNLNGCKLRIHYKNHDKKSLKMTIQEFKYLALVNQKPKKSTLCEYLFLTKTYITEAFSKIISKS